VAEVLVFLTLSGRNRRGQIGAIRLEAELVAIEVVTLRYIPVREQAVVADIDIQLVGLFDRQKFVVYDHAIFR
jgi:hypothetical protein